MPLVVCVASSTRPKCSFAQRNAPHTTSDTELILAVTAPGDVHAVMRKTRAALRIELQGTVAPRLPAQALQVVDDPDAVIGRLRRTVETQLGPEGEPGGEVLGNRETAAVEARCRYVNVAEAGFEAEIPVGLIESLDLRTLFLCPRRPRTAPENRHQEHSQRSG